MILPHIAEATASGATVEQAAEGIGLTARTIERWKKAPATVGDRRTGPKTTPKHALSKEERERMVAIATSPEYRNISVRQLVPRLADDGICVASESSFYRVLHEEGLMAHRGHAKPASGKSKPRSHVATSRNGARRISAMRSHLGDAVA